jgi:periplasmic divalent cation tolerance protein
MDVMDRLVVVYTTVAKREDARRIARAVVEGGLVACAQIEEIESWYVWQGEVVNEPELRIAMKTVARRYAEVERAVLSMHPYALPAIHAVSVDAVHAPYAEWVAHGSGEPTPERTG